MSPFTDVCMVPRLLQRRGNALGPSKDGECLGRRFAGRWGVRPWGMSVSQCITVLAHLYVPLAPRGTAKQGRVQICKGLVWRWRDRTFFVSNFWGWGLGVGLPPPQSILYTSIGIFLLCLYFYMPFCHSLWTLRVQCYWIGPAIFMCPFARLPLLGFGQGGWKNSAGRQPN